MMPATDYDYGTIEAEWAKLKANAEAMRAEFLTTCECGGEITEPGLYGLCELCEADAAEEAHAAMMADDHGF